MMDEKKDNYVYPCDKCEREMTCTNGCAQWKEQYLHRQKKINAFAEKFLPGFYARQKEGSV